MRCIFEYRPQKYMFSLKNYGELPDTFNKADGDPWDIFAPGYPKLKINKVYKIKRCLGVLLLEDGNHKIAVELKHTKGFNAKKAIYEIFMYKKKYCDYVGVSGHFVPLQ